MREIVTLISRERCQGTVLQESITPWLHITTERNEGLE